MKLKLLYGIAVLAALLVIIIVIELLLIKFGGKPVPVPDTPRTSETYGSGPELTYVVLGDSTSVTQGGDYDKGIARSTARYLARQHGGLTVSLHNLGVSGARTKDVSTKQLPAATELHPDVVLVDIGANDITHLSRISTVRYDLGWIIDGLRSANPAVTIVLTGAPEMGSVPRFPQPIRYAAKLRTAQLNRMVVQLAAEKQVGFAPIAAQTGPAFAAHPELFAADKFHPTTDGYQLWIPVLNNAIDSVIPQ